jgi:hypothetical protein
MKMRTKVFGRGHSPDEILRKLSRFQRTQPDAHPKLIQGQRHISQITPAIVVRREMDAGLKPVP